MKANSANGLLFSWQRSVTDGLGKNLVRAGEQRWKPTMLAGEREGGGGDLGQLDFITSFSLLQIELEVEIQCDQVFPNQKICVASFLVSHQAYNV